LNSKDYHDYVFKDGRLVGKFDEMYKNCSDPWIQSLRKNSLDIRVMNKLLRDNFYPRILEYGCGLGHIANFLTKFGSVLGLDISETGISKAKNLYNNVEFDTCDILKGIDFRKNHMKNEIKEKEYFDLIVLIGTLWYVVKEIDFVFSDIKDHLHPGGEFFLSLPFPPLSEKYYGKDIIPDQHSLEEYVRKYFKLITIITIKDEKNPDRPTFFNI